MTDTTFTIGAAAACSDGPCGAEVREACTLLEDQEGVLELGDVCPSWVMPNADAAGYYRWSLAPRARSCPRGATRPRASVRRP